MNRRHHLWGNDRAAELVEFAVALPLLVVFVVGIFDFSGAFTLKQKLTNVARDAARAAASEPSTDLQSAGPVPVSVSDAFQMVDYYLIANHLNDCGVALTGSAGLTWTYSGTNVSCPPGGLTIIINRGYYFPATTSSTPATADCSPQAAGSQTAVISTCVSVRYAYQWRFGRAASLLGFSAALPGTITATAVAMNEN